MNEEFLNQKFEEEDPGCSVCFGKCKPQEDCPEVWVCIDKNCSVHNDE